MQGPSIRRLYYSTKEVSDITQVTPELIKLWEDSFSHLKPSKNKSGRRMFKPEDVKKILRIKEWKENGYSDVEINQMVQSTDIPEDGSGKGHSDNMKSNDMILLFEIHNELKEILNILDGSVENPDHLE
jgi:DNA-binding transcriptional MerR regulator